MNAITQKLLDLADTAPEWQSPSRDPAKPVAQDGSKSLPFEGFKLSDQGNGERFAWQHGSRVRYCYAWESWLVWDGTRWIPDAMGSIERLAKETVRSIRHEAADADQAESKAIWKWADESEKRSSINSMIALARSEPKIPVALSSLDSGAWLLNCENGTVDLTTGTLREHRQTDFITKKCPIYFPTEFHDDEPSTWLNFLDRIFASNTELIRFVQRLIGISLVGEVREHILPIFWGKGQNGKSTLVETWSGMLGEDYAMSAPRNFLMWKKFESHPTELAGMFGKRLVSAIETQEGGKIDESLIKWITGGDKIRARKMREDFWEFMPSHTVVLATNHKPEISGTDFAIWRRVSLVPFIVTIPESERDGKLKGKLQKEWPQILKWAVSGCLDWLRNGLQQPEMVKVATEEYKNTSDTFGNFFDERCLIGPSFRIKASKLYGMYKSWAKQSGEDAISQMKFGLLIGDRGIEKKTSNGVWYIGITNSETEQGSESVSEGYDEYAA